jgi:C_GCAxxG_C_C family probable redox protein
MNKNRVAKTVQKFQAGSSCAQAVLSTYLPVLGVPEGLAHKMGSGLGGGIGRKQYVCGALNAGAIVLSTKFGNESNEQATQKEYSSVQVRQFVENFEQKFGSAQCRDLLNTDINTPAGKAVAAETEVFRKVCDTCVKHVAQELEEALQPKFT